LYALVYNKYTYPPAFFELYRWLGTDRVHCQEYRKQATRLATITVFVDWNTLNTSGEGGEVSLRRIITARGTEEFTRGWGQLNVI